MARVFYCLGLFDRDFEAEDGSSGENVRASAGITSSLTPCMATLASMAACPTSHSDPFHTRE